MITNPHPKPMAVRVGIALFSVAVALLAWVQATLRVDYEREQAISTAIQRNANLAIAFDNYALLILRNADTVARFVADRTSRRSQKDDLNWLVSDRVANNTLLSAISIFNVQGDLVASSVAPPSGKANVAAAEYFRVHAETAGNELHIGKPALSGPKRELLVPLSRPIQSADGKFAGIVLVEVQPARFTEFYQDAAIGDGDVISIIGFDGITRSRRNGPRLGAGEDVSSSPILQMRLKQAAGSHAGTGAVDGKYRYFSYRTMRNYPLLVVVGSERSEILAEHAQRTVRYYSAAAVFSLVSLVIGAGLIFALVRRQRLNAAIAEREERLRFVLESSRLGYWSRDLIGERDEHTLLHDQLFGFTTLLPRWDFATFLSCVHPDDRPRLEQANERLMSDATNTDAEYRVIWPDGTIHWLWSTARLDRDPQGRPALISGVVLDVSTRKQAELQLAQLNIELEDRVRQRTLDLEAAYRELEAFSFSVSHDLRAPLNVMDGFSAILQKDFREQLPAEAQRFLDGIRRNAKKLSALIDDLLASARTSTQAMSRQTVVTEELVREALAEVNPERPAAEYLVRIGELPPCYGDRTLLKQLWINLLSNAFKYSSRRESPLIEIGCETIDGQRTWFVRDNGAGFNMAYAQKLFQVFQRLHTGSEFPGTGIGLAIVQRIVTRHGGRVWAVSAEDQGATFYFTLDTEPASPAA